MSRARNARSRANRRKETPESEQKKEFKLMTARYALFGDVMTAVQHFEPHIVAPVLEYINRNSFGDEENLCCVDIGLDKLFPDQRFSEETIRYFEEKTVMEAEDKTAEPAEIPGKTPPMSLEGALLLPLNSIGQDVISAAHQLISNDQNCIYKTTGDSLYSPPQPDQSFMMERRRKLMELSGKNDEQDDKEVDDLIRIPAVNLHVNSFEETKGDNFHRALNCSPITNIVNIQTWTGVNFDVFKLDNLIRCYDELKVTLLLQVPQPNRSNQNSEGEHCWKTFGVELENVPARTYVRYVARRRWRGAKALHNLIKCKNDKEREKFVNKEIREMISSQQDDLRLSVKEFPNLALCDKSLFYNAFCTNVDMCGNNANVFQTQMEELNKLPERLRPVHEGNLLNMMGVRISGVNSVQVYVKTRGCRTDAHMEHSLVPSVNINTGPGNCIWNVVPYEYYGKIEHEVVKRGGLYHFVSYWPNIKELEAKGIPVTTFIQKPGDMVYVNSGTFHWVQAIGEATNVSYNIASASFEQLSISMIAHAHNWRNEFSSRVPLVHIAWQIARNKMYTEDERIVKIVRSICMRSLAHLTMRHDEIEANANHRLFQNEQMVDWDPSSFVNRKCSGQCGIELFDIIRWVLAEDTYNSFCCVCEPEYKKGDYFTYTYDEEDLIKWFDEYKYIPRDEASSTVSEVVPLQESVEPQKMEEVSEEIPVSEEVIEEEVNVTGAVQNDVKLEDKEDGIVTIGNSSSRKRRYEGNDHE